MVEPSPSSLDRPERDALNAWLAAIARGRDLTVPPPHDNPALKRFVDGLRGELHAFRAIVDAAADTVALNTRQLASVAATTADYSAMVERTAASVGEMDRSAHAVADAGANLSALVATMAASTRAYEAGVDEILAGFAALARTVEATAQFAGGMDHGAAGITAFLERLRRLARQARLLAINAAIEAAHLGDLGSGFVIVAEEVKKLSSSTGESANSVAAIEAQLHETSARVGAVLAGATAAVQHVTRDLTAARDRSGSTHGDVVALGTSVEDVAAIAGQQSAAITHIAASVEAVAGHAREIQSASQRAAELAIGDALGRLRASVDQYVLGAVVADDGADSDLDALPPELRTAAAALRDRVDADERQLLEAITRIAVAVARNTFEWRAIGDGLRGLRTHLSATAIAIDETRAGATAAAGATARMRSALGAIGAGFAASLDELERCLERVDRVREAIGQAESFVVATSEAGSRASAILDIIEAISGDTTLLALNAAIEAAHAGLAGSGFGIIADEIRLLADTTAQATQEISGVLAEVGQASIAMSGTTGEAVAQTDDVRQRTARMREIVTRLREDLEQTQLRASEVASISEQQLAALADVRSAADLALGRVDGDSAMVTDARRLELANLGMRAHALAARRPLGTLAETMRDVGAAVAAEMDGVFDDAIASGAIRLDDCFDTAYVELTGDRVQELARLFDVSKVPPAGFDPPKFRTRYDRAVEAGFNAIIDRWVPQYPAIKAMFAVDLNGFCFGHYKECRHDWTGEYTTDLNHNRIKRFFEDALSLRCSRGGLGASADDLPARTPYARFREAGCTLQRTAERPWVIYTYARDTGIVYNDLSVGLFAGDHRVATIRIIYDADRV